VVPEVGLGVEPLLHVLPGAQALAPDLDRRVEDEEHLVGERSASQQVENENASGGRR
jgi:hypothetical protein